ncbi:hypothetical protein D3C71_1752480 [compost metagenome]
MEFEVGFLEAVTRFAQRTVQVEALVLLGAGVAGDTHRGRQRVVMGHLGHCRAIAGHIGHGLAGRCGSLRGAARQTLLDSLEQLLQRDRLFQEGECTDARGLHGGVDGGVTAHHDHRHGELPRGRPLLEQRDAVRVGHPDVQQNQVIVARQTR